MAKDNQIKGAWSDLAIAGARLAVRVTPNARANTASRDNATLRITVTASPEDGRATDAVTVLLARALGVARTRLVLTSGATSRDKVFRLDP
jgi:uncharacterized protein